jgi:hypothetical protein
MDATALEEMLARDQAEWDALAALLDAHPGGPVHDPESPAWEARHVYAHLARWIDNSMDDFEAALAGRPKPAAPPGTDDEVNARWRAEDAGITFYDARNRAQGAVDRRTQLIRSVPADGWNPLLDAIARADGYEHIRGHRRYIEAAAS